MGVFVFILSYKAHTSFSVASSNAFLSSSLLLDSRSRRYLKVTGLAKPLEFSSVSVARISDTERCLKMLLSSTLKFVNVSSRGKGRPIHNKKKQETDESSVC